MLKLEVYAKMPGFYSAGIKPRVLYKLGTLQSHTASLQTDSDFQFFNWLHKSKGNWVLELLSHCKYITMAWSYTFQ